MILVSEKSLTVYKIRPSLISMGGVWHWIFLKNKLHICQEASEHPDSPAFKNANPSSGETPFSTYELNEDRKKQNQNVWACLEEGNPSGNQFRKTSQTLTRNSAL